ncbi:MAG: hypothetical protein ACRC28_04295 [Clostridium sp.]
MFIKMLLGILIFVVCPIEIIFLIKSKVLIRSKLLIIGITLLIFLLLGGDLFLLHIRENKINQAMLRKNSYIENIVSTTTENLKDYNKNDVYSNDIVLNFLITAYTYTVNGENKVGTAIQDKLDGKITNKKLTEIINNEDAALTTFSDALELLFHSGYLNKENTYQSSIISGSIASLVDINKNFISKGITYDTITNFNETSTNATSLMKNVLHL